MLNTTLLQGIPYPASTIAFAKFAIFATVPGRSNGEDCV